MKYTVVGVIDGRRMEMPIQASSVVDAIKAAEAEGMIVTDAVAAVAQSGKTEVERSLSSARKPGTDSPVLCAIVGLLLPIVGFLMALVKCRKDPTGALACLLGSVVGFLLWGAVFHG